MPRPPRLIAGGVAALALAALGLAAPAPADAQSRAQLDARLRGVEQAVREQEDRLGVLERDRLSGDPVAVRLIERLDALEAQAAAMTGALERVALENQQLRARVATLIREIELRDRQIADATGLPPAVYGPFDTESPVFSFTRDGQSGGAAQIAAGAPGAPGAEGPAALATPATGASLGFEAAATPRPPAAAPTDGEDSTPVTLPDDPEAALQRAKDFVIVGRYDDAASALSQFVERFRDSELLGEAWFWRGEVDFVRSVYDGAAKSYISSLDVDPEGPKAPEAMIRLASSLNALGVTEEACTTLDDFDRQYRRASPTVKAKAQRVRDTAKCP